MVVHEDVPGIHAKVMVGGKTLTEFPTVNDEIEVEDAAVIAHYNRCTITRYIASFEDDAFIIKLKPMGWKAIKTTPEDLQDRDYPENENPLDELGEIKVVVNRATKRRPMKGPQVLKGPMVNQKSVYNEKMCVKGNRTHAMRWGKPKARGGREVFYTVDSFDDDDLPLVIMVFKSVSYTVTPEELQAEKDRIEGWKRERELIDAKIAESEKRIEAAPVIKGERASILAIKREHPGGHGSGGASKRPKKETNREIETIDLTADSENEE
ncbi:uncharacterized protein RAG0_14413 [Rhynchosporium agropyri]|uniref:Uncharacterized protein n=1 Tax=Rhynchosporium agropyri TaxID=914238 RepID=A0A1E1LH02_9HELO|nr:uncharacterized protein RAG0_14413 [Rhynchosporium agropyri]